MLVYIGALDKYEIRSFTGFMGRIWRHKIKVNQSWATTNTFVLIITVYISVFITLLLFVSSECGNVRVIKVVLFIWVLCHTFAIAR